MTCELGLQEEAASIHIEDEEDVVKVLDLLLQAEAGQSTLQGIYSHPTNALPFLQPGRLVCVPQPPAGARHRPVSITQAGSLYACLMHDVCSLVICPL